jgi:hypothetical protein
MKLKELQRRRSEIQVAMNEIGIMRSGSLSIRYQKCGKAKCICKSKGHPGHGPVYSYSIKDERINKTVIRSYPPGPKLEKLQQEIENYHRYKELNKEYILINNEISKVTEMENENKDIAKELKKNSLKT